MDEKKKKKRKSSTLTLLLADSYMSPSTLRAYATRFSIRRSFSAAGSGVGNMACTLREVNGKWLKTWFACDRNHSIIIVYLFIFFKFFYRSDSQFVHQVGAQVLSDVLVPGLSHSAGRERGGGGQVRQSASHRPVWHQLTGDGDETSNRHSEPYL